MATGGSPLQILRELSRHPSESESGLCLSEELELLQNVYFDDLQVISDENTSLLFHVTPSTCDNKETQYVYCDVTFTVNDKKYPALNPHIAITKSRGLSDAHIESIADGLLHLSLRNLGSPMIYDLVEYVRDCLTDNNRPCGRCPICQYDFQDDDCFVRTECYHYFHPNCLSRYVSLHFESMATQKEENKLRRGLSSSESLPQKLECPVCRVAIGDQDHCLLAMKDMETTNPESSGFYEYSYCKDPQVLAWQKEMALLFERQQKKGGIIDLSAQDAVIDGEWVISNASQSIGQDDCNERGGVTKSSSSSVQVDGSTAEGDSHSKGKTQQARRHYKGDSWFGGEGGGGRPKEDRNYRGRREDRQWRQGGYQRERAVERNSGERWSHTDRRWNHWQRRDDRRLNEEQGVNEGQTSERQSRGKVQDRRSHHHREGKKQGEGEGDDKERTRWRDKRWDRRQQDKQSNEEEREKQGMEKKIIIKRHEKPSRSDRDGDCGGQELTHHHSSETNETEDKRLDSREGRGTDRQRREHRNYESRQGRNTYYKQNHYHAQKQGYIQRKSKIDYSECQKGDKQNDDSKKEEGARDDTSKEQGKM